MPTELITGWRGTIRIYFNDKADYPFVWQLDSGSDMGFIILVKSVILDGDVLMKTVFRKTALYPQPNAWLELQGTVKVENGIAFIVGHRAS